MDKEKEIIQMLEKIAESNTYIVEALQKISRRIEYIESDIETIIGKRPSHHGITITKTAIERYKRDTEEAE